MPDHDGNTAMYRMTLNSTPPLKITELEKNDPLRSLMPINNDWNRFYQIVFAATENDNLTLRLETDLFESLSLTYMKDNR